MPARTQFGKTLHRPDIMFVTERAENAFPQRLLPADLPCAGVKLGGLALQADECGFVQQFQQLLLGQFPQRRGATAQHFLGQRRSRLVTQPKTEFPQRRIERGVQRKRGRRAFSASAVPDHMKNDVSKSGIAVVPVRTPAAGAKIHFHIASSRSGIGKLNHRAAKIGSALDAAKARMKNAHGLAVQGSKLVAEQPLVLPDGLQQAFRRRFAVLAQDRNRAASHTPVGVKTGRDQWHPGIAFARSRPDCQALAARRLNASAG